MWLHYTSGTAKKTPLNGHISSKEPYLNQHDLVQRCRIQQF